MLLNCVNLLKDRKVFEENESKLRHHFLNKTIEFVDKPNCKHVRDFLSYLESKNGDFVNSN